MVLAISFGITITIEYIHGISRFCTNVVDILEQCVEKHLYLADFIYCILT